MLEGRSAPFSIGTGSLHRLASWLSALAFGPTLKSLHLPTLLAFLLENILLWRLAKEMLDERAAAAALFFNLICAFSFLRLRSLLSFSVFPGEFLLVLNLLLISPSRPKALIAGLLAGLFTLDYEGWLAGCAIIFVMAFTPSQRPWKSCLAGLALGLGASAWLSAENLRAWLQVRGAYSGMGGGGMAHELQQNLKAFFMGGETVSYLGPDGHPAVPRWSWPFLIVGLWKLKSRPGIWAWLLLGLSPLTLTSYGSEPNRAIAAWPVLALACGAGWQSAVDFLERQGRSFKRMHGAILLALLCLGLADESQAMLSSQNRANAYCYGRSQTLIQAASKLREEAATHGLTLLSNLDFNYGAELRFLCGPLATSDTQVLAWIPNGDMIQFDSKAGPWISVQAQKEISPEYFLIADAAWSKRLRLVDGQINHYQSLLPLFEQAKADAMIFNWLDETPGLDPWVRTALWSRVMNDQAAAGRLEPKRVDQILGEKLVSADPLYQPGIIALRSQPRLGLKMLKAAARLDRRRKLDEMTLRRIESLASDKNAF